VYKLGRVHFLLDHLSNISHGEPIEGVDDHLLDAHLFNVGIDWYGPIIEYLRKGYFDNNVPKKERSWIVKRAKSYTLYDRQLYKLGLDGVLWQCLFPKEASKVFEDFHEEPIGRHFGMNIIVKRCCPHVIGGPLCTKMLSTCVKIVTSASN
jgi:hypothetical protein